MINLMKNIGGPLKNEMLKWDPPS